jgi:hypothetical protein
MELKVILTGKHNHSNNSSSNNNPTVDEKDQNSTSNTSIKQKDTTNIIETEIHNEFLKETEIEEVPQINKDTKLGPLRGKERLAVVKEIIEKYDGDCDRFRKDKQGENNALYYSLDTLKKAKSQYLLNNSDYNWINALTTTASTLQASLKGNVSGKY